jgi:hypothetical protein
MFSGLGFLSSSCIHANQRLDVTPTARSTTVERGRLQQLLCGCNWALGLHSGDMLMTVPLFNPYFPCTPAATHVATQASTFYYVARSRAQSHNLLLLSCGACTSITTYGGGIVTRRHVAHNKSGIADRSKSRRSETVVNHKRGPLQQPRLPPNCTNCTDCTVPVVVRMFNNHEQAC